MAVAFNGDSSPTAVFSALFSKIVSNRIYMETEYLMRSPAMIDAIRQGENDIENGRFMTMEDDESPKEFLSRCTSD